MKIKYDITEYYKPFITEFHHDKGVTLIYKLDDLRICVDIEDAKPIFTSLFNVKTRQVITTNSKLIPFINGSYLFIDVRHNEYSNATIILHEMRN